MAANIITLIRIPLSLLLLVFTPYSYTFILFYLLCGFSDVLDGYVARKLRTESEKGAISDSISDLFFAFVYIIRILPLLTIPLFIRIWTAAVTIIKITNIIVSSKKVCKLHIEHSLGNKLTGLLLFFLPFTVYIPGIMIYAEVLVCTAATVTAISEIFKNINDTQN